MAHIYHVGAITATTNDVTAKITATQASSDWC